MPLIEKLGKRITTFKYLWSTIFALCALEGLIALIVETSLPSDQDVRIVLGFSAGRLILLALMVAFILFFICLALLNIHSTWRVNWDRQLRVGALSGFLLFILLPIYALLSLYILVLLKSSFHATGDVFFTAYYNRLWPFIVWGFLVSLQVWVMVVLRGGFHRSELHAARPVLRAGLIVYLIALLLAIFVALSRIGITPDTVGWGTPAVALLEWQVLLGWLCGALFLYLLLHNRWPKWADLVLAVGIFALAAGIWLSVPTIPNIYAPQGRPPNYEIYQFSDGAYYDLFSQSALIGNGFEGNGIPARPMYVTILTLFHLAAGQEYDSIIFVQTLLLSFFPVVLYFLGKELHSRPTGLFVALLAIFREWNASLSMPFIYNGSTSKLFFADLPTALVISLWTLLTVLWLNAPTRRTYLPILAGGVLGVGVLFRTQTILLLPLILLLAFMVLHGYRRFWLTTAGMIIAGFILAVAPWLWRNAQITGELIFDDPFSQASVMADRYSLQGEELRFQKLPGESMSEFTDRVNQEVVHFLRIHPGFVADFIANHWLNAEISNLQILPLRNILDEWKGLLIPTTPFWEWWDGTPRLTQLVLLLLYLGLVSFGIGTAWSRVGWVGMLPLLVNLVYNASTAVARFSGNRYLLPVDWAAYVYAAIGLMEIVVLVSYLLGVSSDRMAHLLTLKYPLSEGSKMTPLKWWPVIGIGTMILFIGCLPLIVERSIPRRYPIQSQTELNSELMHSIRQLDSDIDLVQLQKFLLDPQAQIIKGRALYPRFYGSGEGEPQTAKAGYAPLLFPRTLFLLAAEEYNGLVMLKMQDPPAYLPNASDVIVVGCRTEKYLDAQVVLIAGEPGELIISDSEMPSQCPSSSSGARSLPLGGGDVIIKNKQAGYK